MNENVIVCDRCGCEITTDDYIEFDSDILCSECASENTTLCSHCGERIWEEDNAGSDSVPLCSDCYDDYYTTCEDCGRIIHRDCACYVDDYDDSPYCESCFENHNSGAIHDYSYKPEPIFYGDGYRFFGVELEIDYGGKDSDNAEEILAEGNRNENRIYIKSDGSLDEGLEIVTHPMTLDYHRLEMPWDDVTEMARKLGYRSHKTATCGLHVHVNRTTFGETREAQDDCISRVLYFVEHHWEELLKFSRRTQSQMDRWAARYGYKNTPKEVMEHAKKGHAGRYTCVNITNWNTIEFRMFRGTLKLNTILATLELVDLICKLAIEMDDDEISKLSWTDFVELVDNVERPELVTYLKERRLYVNEPVDVKEDD